MFNNRYLLILLVIAVVVVCLCDNNKAEPFCDINVNNDIPLPQNRTPPVMARHNNINGILDDSVINASGVNMLNQLKCNTSDVLDMENETYSKMKASEEPDFPDYAKL